MRKATHTDSHSARSNSQAARNMIEHSGQVRTGAAKVGTGLPLEVRTSAHLAQNSISDTITDHIGRLPQGPIALRRTL